MWAGRRGLRGGGGQAVVTEALRNKMSQELINTQAFRSQMVWLEHLGVQSCFTVVHGEHLHLLQAGPRGP